MDINLKINGKTLIGLLLLGSGFAFAEFVSVLDNKSTYIIENKSTPVYDETDNKETVYPIGHVMVAWLGNGNPGYGQSNINKTTKLYIVNDREDYQRYSADWYGSHSSGTYVEGEWQYRGYVGSLAGVNSGLFVRVK